MIYVFWALAAPTGALATVLLAMSLAGRRLSMATPVWLTLLSCLGVAALLVWAYQLATAGARPGLACAIVVLSWFALALTMLANGLAHQGTWQ